MREFDCRKLTSNYKTISFEISHKKVLNQHNDDMHMGSPRLLENKGRKVLSKIIKIDLYKDSNAEEVEENFRIIKSRVGRGLYRKK